MAKKSFLNAEIMEAPAKKTSSGIFGDELGVSRVLELNVSLIDASPFQPRLEIDKEELQGLADSIASQGLMQPIVVRKGRVGRYEVVAGHRRLAAINLLGKESIRAIISDVTDEQMRIQVLVENIQRSDLNHFEVALGIETIKKSMDIELAEIANVIGKSPSYVTKALSVLKLSDFVKDTVRAGEYKTLNVLYALNKHVDTQEVQDTIFREILDKKLNEADAITLIKNGLSSTPKKQSGGFNMTTKALGNVVSLSLNFKKMNSDEKENAIGELESLLQRLKEE